jgi:hypothetical protein
MRQIRFILVVLLVPVVVGSVWPCSICRCGDPTFNALGDAAFASRGLRLALDWDQVRKTQGASNEELESLRERRTTLLVALGLSDRLSLFGRIPYSDRRLTGSEDGATEIIDASGFADPELYGQSRLWTSGFSGDVGVRAAVFASLGVKVGWGENDLSRDGLRLDEHVQPGTGATDVFAGLSSFYQIDPRSSVFVSAQHRRTGRSAYGYRYGNATLLNLAYEHKLSARWDMVVEGNFRHAGRDQIAGDGSTDPDTGGSILYMTPRILLNLGAGWVARASTQVPIAQAGLYGEQREKTVFNLGVTRSILR